MKKIISIMLAVIVLVFSLCSCHEKTQPEVKLYADMLCLTNSEKTYLGCSERFACVVAPVCAIVQILETQNNEVIRKQNETDYFKNERYILTSFEPFDFLHFDLTKSFDKNMNNSLAQSVYLSESNGKNIVFEREKENYSLSFISEEETEECVAQYDKSNDSLLYVYSVDDDNGKRNEEFLEFAKTEDGVYLVQTHKARAYVIFDEENRVKSFVCSELKDGDYSDEMGIYPHPEDINAQNAEEWVMSRDKNSYISIHSYKDNILTHEDCSSGPWKKTEINALGYSSAFNL